MLQERQSSEDNSQATASDVIQNSRCPLKPEVENPLRIAAKQQGLTHCELLEQFVVQGLETKRFEAECAQAQAKGMPQDERCKFFTRPK